MVKVLKEEQQRTGIKLLWGTANLFSNPRYVHGAATSCNADAFAFAAAQVKKALEVTKELGGQGYVFWGGREGYQCLWNTDMKREVEHLAAFMHMAVDYAKKIGFTGQFYFEPKPKEPTKHQYDFDCAACINFLRAYGLADHVKMNIETNHATLAGHTVEHELDYAGSQGFLGSVDANTGDLLLGWDTDQFPTDVYLTTKIMLVILKYGGFTTGGLNFDAKVRRESFEPIDLFYAHIGGMDAFAKGLKIAAAIRADGVLAGMVKDRYSSWDSGVGAEIEAGRRRLRVAGEVHAGQGATCAEPQRPARAVRERRQPVRVLTAFAAGSRMDSIEPVCRRARTNWPASSSPPVREVNCSASKPTARAPATWPGMSSTKKISSGRQPASSAAAWKMAASGFRAPI